MDRIKKNDVMTSNNYKSDMTMLKREEGEGAEEEVSSTSICDDIESVKSFKSLIEGPQILSGTEEKFLFQAKAILPGFVRVRLNLFFLKKFEKRQAKSVFLFKNLRMSVFVSSNA